MSATKSILVLGAGELGIEVLRSLALHPSRKDTQIAVLRRTVPSKIDEARFEPLNIAVVAGDVANDSQRALSAMFSSFHTVINCTGMAVPPSTQIKVAQAAIEGSVVRYFPWQFGGDYDAIGCGSPQDLFDIQLDVRDILRAQTEMEWVIISNGMFTSFLFEPFFGVVSADRGTVTALGSWETAITVTSPQDIGRLAAEIALASPETKGVVYIAGDTVTMHQLAEVVEAATGKKVTRVLKTLKQLETELAEDLDDAVKKYRVVFAQGRGVAWDKSSTFNAQRGIETETAGQWAAKRLVVA